MPSPVVSRRSRAWATRSFRSHAPGDMPVASTKRRQNVRGLMPAFRLSLAKDRFSPNEVRIQSSTGDSRETFPAVGHIAPARRCDEVGPPCRGPHRLRQQGHDPGARFAGRGQYPTRSRPRSECPLRPHTERRAEGVRPGSASQNPPRSASASSHGDPRAGQPPPARRRRRKWTRCGYRSGGQRRAPSLTAPAQSLPALASPER